MALPLLAFPAAAAAAQAPAPETPLPPPAASAPIATIDSEGIIEFSADQVVYDSDNDIVTASGKVRMSRDGNYLAADLVTWSRKTGEVRAQGDVVVVDPQGDKMVGENVVLSDTLKAGTVQNLLFVL
jgi:LPS-assembly protein